MSDLAVYDCQALPAGRMFRSLFHSGRVATESWFSRTREAAQPRLFHGVAMNANAVSGLTPAAGPCANAPPQQVMPDRERSQIRRPMGALDQGLGANPTAQKTGRLTRFSVGGRIPMNHQEGGMLEELPALPAVTRPPSMVRRDAWPAAGCPAALPGYRCINGGDGRGLTCPVGHRVERRPVWRPPAINLASVDATPDLPYPPDTEGRTGATAA